MALFNYATKEITLKVVYYGPGLSGKTTNLQYLHSVLNPETKGKLLSISTESDRTLFFDFLPVELGKIRDFSIRFQLYTVPGQVRYNATRKVVLKGADAVVFVADSQVAMKEQNHESFENMRENLAANNINPDDIPVVLQYNKRDLKNIASLEELNGYLNSFNYPFIESSALSGAGVEETFRLITKLLIKDIARKHNVGVQASEPREVPAQHERVTTPPVSPQSPQAEATVVSSAPGVQVPSEVPEQPEQLTMLPVCPQYTETEASVVSADPGVQISETGDTALQPPSPASAEGPLSEEEPPPAPSPSVTMSMEEPAGHHEAGGGPEQDRKALPAAREVQAEKIDLLVDEIVKIHGILIELKDSVGLITDELNNLKTIKEGQQGMLDGLKDIEDVLTNLRSKKKWFHF